MEMNIQKFAERTGLPPSTLRFYDRKKLIEPAGRSEKGYRIYTEEQIHKAMVIHSLRQADIKIEEIQSYLQGEEEEKMNWISGWKRELEEKLASMNIAKQYLNSMDAEERHLHLVKWEGDSFFIWFRRTVPRTFHPFQEEMFEISERLKTLRIETKAGVFVRTLESKGDTITGEVGCLLQNQPCKEIGCYRDMYTERTGPSLFAAVECNVYDPFTCFHFMWQIQRFGFKAEGIKMEKYESPESRTFSYLIPLKK
ncbi:MULTISPECIES: MerR family transcriptional regulator [Bacillus]|uniref:MerR family transcriptional regulator n=1 Tax=Bacillus TaxID=1386 RepID=UPI002880E0A3|nr:MerR family transcriptional regulator [Bacillus sp. AG4(2022)]MDT0163392.1 MerR family transcriptional regulator [Bacillus sp. AG4(2022)]